MMIFNMLKKIAILSLLLISPILAFANGAGYGKTTWGMSPQEVVAVESNRATLIEPKKYSGAWGKVQINNVSIGSGSYTVDFLFDESDKLVQTNVTSNEKRKRLRFKVYVSARKSRTPTQKEPKEQRALKNRK